MQDFDIKRAKEKQNSITEKVRSVYQSLQQDVVSYYWSRTPASEEVAREYRQGMRKYIKQAYEKLGSLLDELDRGI